MQKHSHDTVAEISEQFPTETTDLAEAHGPEVVELSNGDEFELRIAPVAKALGDATVRMLTYNGSIPGPTLRVREGSELLVNVRNDGDLEATVHWHGLRLENAYDGTHETQAPIPVGGTFSYRVRFPDPGVYWYHPHIREDYGQEMGLYANVLVEPADPDYWPPAHRELALTLDDILLDDGKVAPFSRAETTYAAMGRFGDVLLVNGETDLSLDAKLGEVVRLYLTNTANTRTFKVALPGARMKLVGGDSGHVEHEHHGHAHEHSHAAADGIEWEDDMVEVNRMTTPANMRWKIVDRETDAENAAIAWRFRVGDQVKIRLLNEMAGDHPMHHPFHVHGAGRFLILSRDGAVEHNLVWKDTVLVRTGETVDILLDVTNPGR